MLSFRNRFHGHGSLRYVYKNGQAVRSRLITMKYTHNPHRKQCRVAVVVSKKVHKSAVGRNRIRRRIYEVIRHELGDIQTNHDMVFLVFSSEVLSLPAPELKDAIQQLVRNADIYKKAV